MNVPEPLSAAARRRTARPELNQLEVFLKVIETGSFSGAARQLGKTQPAISQTIARLEEIYCGELFERRHGAPLTLTPIGKAILPSARMLLHTANELMQRAVATAQGQLGSLTIGLDASLGLRPLGAGIRVFLAASPDVRLRIVEAAARNLHGHLNEGTIDIMFVMSEPRPVDAMFVRELLWQERLMVVLREDHPLSPNESVDFRDLSSLSLIVRTSQLAAAQAILEMHGDHSINCEVHDVSHGTLLDLVAMGLGQTIAIESAIAPKLGVVARPIEGEHAMVSIEGIWLQKKCNPLRDRLLDHVRTSAQPSW